MKKQELAPETRAIWEDPLPRDEFERRLRTYLEDEQSIADTIELIEWFIRRYPTAEARLAYARRKYAEALARSGIAGPRGR
jgi:hypothetical protein